MGMDRPDYYATLGVPRGASEKEIRSAFRKLARKHHPDVNPGDRAAEDRFKSVNEAYEVLSDPEKRKLYDELGARWRDAQQGGPQRPPGAGGFRATWRPGDGTSGSRTAREEDLADLFGDASPFSDYFQEYFAGAPRGGRAQGAPRAAAGADAEAVVEVSIGEAYSGATRVVQLTQPDGSTRRLEATIPAGVTDGSRVRLSGQGASGTGGGPAGDLYLVVSIAPDPRFEREGADVRTRIGAPLPTLVLGGTVRVPKPDGKSLELTIRPGSQDGRVYRLRGQGMPTSPGGTRRGDLLAEVHVELPTEPTGRQRELLEELARLSSPAGATGSRTTS
jgi:DnaJ-class molecular chaperone